MNLVFQEIADISTSQSKALDAQQVSRDKEVLSMRQQLLDFQSQSDEKTVIGKNNSLALIVFFFVSRDIQKF